MPRHIFKGRVIAAAGPLPGQLTVDKLKQWTQLRQGVFSDDFDETTTHLLCTQEQFSRRVPRVREALKRGKRCHIVHCDWFEFSAVAEKRQPEREYSMRSILAKQNAAKREQARIERGKKEGDKFVNTNFYHIYVDRDFFPYQVDVTRHGHEAGEPGQRYSLCLWESNAKPHLYWFAAKFLKRRGDSQPSYYRPSRCSGKWHHEMGLFMDFFRIKTGLEWQDRVLGQKTMPESFFQYAPPTGGKPVGRRLRFCYEYCLELNAQRRGLPWPPVEEAAAAGADVGVKAQAAEGQDVGDSVVSSPQDDSPEAASDEGAHPETLPPSNAEEDAAIESPVGGGQGAAGHVGDSLVPSHQHDSVQVVAAVAGDEIALPEAPLPPKEQEDADVGSLGGGGQDAAGCSPRVLAGRLEAAPETTMTMPCSPVDVPDGE